MVLVGKVNRDIVSSINVHGALAVGRSVRVPDHLAVEFGHEPCVRFGARLHPPAHLGLVGRGELERDHECDSIE